MLTPEQMQILGDRLLAEKSRLEHESARLAADIDEAADCSITDRADAASLQERTRRAASLRSHREQALAEVEAALARMEAGRYGVDEETGEPIAFERLKVVPWARTA